MSCFLSSCWRSIPTFVSDYLFLYLLVLLTVGSTNLSARFIFPVYLLPTALHICQGLFVCLFGCWFSSVCFAVLFQWQLNVPLGVFCNTTPSLFPLSTLFNAPAQPRSGKLWTQKLKSHLMRTQNLKVLHWKPGVGQYITMHATFTARDFFLANFYHSDPFTFIFFQNLSKFFPLLAVANTGSCVGPQNKIGHPAGCRFPCWVPTEYKLAKKTWLVVWWLAKEITWRLKFVFSPDVILCGWLGSKHQLTN